MHIHSLVLKNDRNYVDFYEDDIHLHIQVVPWAQSLAQVSLKEYSVILTTPFYDTNQKI